MASLNAPKREQFSMIVAAALAVLGLAGLLIGQRIAPERTMFAYLTSFVFAVSIAVGALFYLLISYAIDSAWMSVTRRIAETISLGILPLAVLFVPIAVKLRWLYPWASAHAGAMSSTPHKAAYLNAPGFVVRGCAYFFVWVLCAWLLSKWSRAREQTATMRPLTRERTFSCAMLPAVSLATTFCAFDWLMSLDPEWSSAMLGVYYFSGGFLSAMALLAILLRGLWRSDARVTPNHFHALGRMLLAFTIFWAYTAYFQVFLVVIAEKPSELAFYATRGHGSWRYLGLTLVVGHAALPISLLLPKAPKFRPAYVTGVSIWLLLMHFVDMYWVVMPFHDPDGAKPHWLDLSALCAICGAVTTFCLWRQRGVPALAHSDPRLEEGLRYASSQ
jgi:hypothetical protein